MLGVEHSPMAARLAQAAEALSVERARERVLERIVQLAPHVIAVAEQASVTLVAEAGPLTAAASDPLSEQINALQYEVGEGPGLAAARTGEIVMVPNLTAESRWPGFTSRMQGQDRVRSMLAVPLRADPRWWAR